MDCCSSTNAWPNDLEHAPEVFQSADKLASLLTQVPEYLEFIRLAQLIHLDPEVNRISIEIGNCPRFHSENQAQSLESLQAELEMLPAVQSFRKVEAALHDLLHSVDQVISVAAGVEFAANALPKACG